MTNVLAKIAFFNENVTSEPPWVDFWGSGWPSQGGSRNGAFGDPGNPGLLVRGRAPGAAAWAPCVLHLCSKA